MKRLKLFIVLNFNETPVLIAASHSTEARKFAYEYSYASPGDAKDWPVTLVGLAKQGMTPGVKMSKNHVFE